MTIKKIIKYNFEILENESRYHSLLEKTMEKSKKR